MQYIKIIGDNHADALKNLRESYGSNVIIFGEKWVPPKGIFSKIIGKKRFLIEAAIREKKQKYSKPPVIDSTGEIASNNDAGSPNHQNHEKLSLLDAIQKTKQIFSGESPKKARMKPDENQQANEVEALKYLIKQIAFDPKLTSPKHPKEFEEIKQVLKRQDLSEAWIDTLIKSLQAEVPRSQWNMKLVLAKRISDYLESKIKTSETFSRRAVALIGPTGVGKTTTIAKLAARLKLQKDQSISLITLDNYRIAATEQLKVYANILDIPVYPCKDPAKLKNIFVEDNADLFLIDTAGLSQKNNEFMFRLDEMFRALDYNIEKHLVISANTKPEDTQEIAFAFDLLKFEKIIISKLDETNRFGHIIELGEKLQKPFSFFTHGQKVPDDHRPAESRYLANKVLEKWLVER